MGTILNFLLRAVLLAAGLVFAASLAVAFVLLVAAWSVRALWFKLTGRPAAPFVVRFRAAEGFRDMARRRAAPIQPRRALGDVTDVEPK